MFIIQWIIVTAEKYTFTFFSLVFCVNEFVNELIQEFPLEYSVELKSLIDFEMNPTNKK
jgi:hypothetical protein